MKTPLKLAIVAALAVAVVAAVTLKQDKGKAPAETNTVAVPAVTPSAPAEITGDKAAPVAAATYRWVVTFSICWFLYRLFQSYDLKIVGQARGKPT